VDGIRHECSHPLWELHKKMGLLRQALLEAAASAEVSLGEEDDYGQRYMLDCEIAGPSGKATVRSSWIVLHGQDFPRLTSCFVL
jgi:hypothetical protein